MTDPGDLVGGERFGEFASRVFHDATLIEPQLVQESLPCGGCQRIQRGRAAGDPGFQLWARANLRGAGIGSRHRDIALGPVDRVRGRTCRKQDRKQRCSSQVIHVYPVAGRRAYRD